MPDNSCSVAVFRSMFLDITSPSSKSELESCRKRQSIGHVGALLIPPLSCAYRMWLGISTAAVLRQMLRSERYYWRMRGNYFSTRKNQEAHSGARMRSTFQVLTALG